MFVTSLAELRVKETDSLTFRVGITSFSFPLFCLFFLVGGRKFRVTSFSRTQHKTLTSLGMHFMMGLLSMRNQAEDVWCYSQLHFQKQKTKKQTKRP